jgi:isocitrate/isopropylmalate dehydrogenase
MNNLDPEQLKPFVKNAAVTLKESTHESDDPGNPHGSGPDITGSATILSLAMMLDWLKMDEVRASADCIRTVVERSAQQLTSEVIGAL